jgi:hypothetical protein
MIEENKNAIQQSIFSPDEAALVIHDILSI